MKYLLDTNHCSYIQQKRPEVIERLQALPPDTEIVTSVITQGELLAGIELIASRRRKQETAESLSHHPCPHGRHSCR